MLYPRPSILSVVSYNVKHRNPVALQQKDDFDTQGVNGWIMTKHWNEIPVLREKSSLGLGFDTASPTQPKGFSP